MSQRVPVRPGDPCRLSPPRRHRKAVIEGSPGPCVDTSSMRLCYPVVGTALISVMITDTSRVPPWAVAEQQ